MRAERFANPADNWNCPDGISHEYMDRHYPFPAERPRDNDEVINPALVVADENHRRIKFAKVFEAFEPQVEEKMTEVLEQFSENPLDPEDHSVSIIRAN